MQATAALSETQRLVQELRTIAERSASERQTVAHLLEALGPSSFAVLALFLTIPFLPPISTGPLAMAGGLTFAMLGWQMLRKDPRPWLPERVRQLAPGPKCWRSLSRLLEWLVGFAGRFTRTRLTDWTQGERGDRWIGLLMITGGVLMAIPFVAVPFNNTFPALVIASAALARLHRDGLMLLVSVFLLKVTLAYFVVIVWALWFLGGEGLEWLRGLASFQ